MAGVTRVFLLRRAKSVKNIRKITKAMGLVATSKFQRSRVYLYASDKQFKALNEFKEDIANGMTDYSGIYFDNKGPDRKLFVVFNSTKGLAGGYNTNLMNACHEQFTSLKNPPYVLATGTKGRAVMTKLPYALESEFFPINDLPMVEDAKAINERVLELYGQGLVNEVYIAYTRYVTQIHQEVIIERILPFESRNTDNALAESEFEFEPSADRMQEVVFSLYLREKFYNTIVHAKVTEHSQRMRAMDTAKKNADELLVKVDKQYNRLRQGAITQELSEIIGGAEAQM